MTMFESNLDLDVDAKDARTHGDEDEGGVDASFLPRWPAKFFNFYRWMQSAY